MSAEKIERFWKNATADDVERVMKGETMEARFRDSTIHLWCERLKLAGVTLGIDGKPRWIASTGSWVFCQVYREPSWWLERPDPGPGWRLLGKLPDEELKEYDEWWNGTHWGVSFRFASGPQSEGVWYRRRIEAMKPESIKLDEGSKCPMQGCSGVLRLRPVKDCACHIRPPCSHCADNPPCCPVCEWTTGDPIEPVEPEPKHCVLPVGYTATLPNGQTITITANGFEVTQ